MDLPDGGLTNQPPPPYYKRVIKGDPMVTLKALTTNQIMELLHEATMVYKRGGGNYEEVAYYARLLDKRAA